MKNLINNDAIFYTLGKTIGEREKNNHFIEISTYKNIIKNN